MHETAKGSGCTRREFLHAASGAALAALLSSLPIRARAGSGVALSNAAVIDVRGGPTRTGLTLMVRDGRIRDILPTDQAKIAPGIQVIDIAGKFVIPGLFNMHAHFCCDECNLLSMVANGVTFVRDMGNIIIKPGGPDGFTYASRQDMIDGILKARGKINRGEILGPALAVPGVILTGPLPDGVAFESPAFQWVLHKEAETRRAVRYLADRGVDFIKTHHMPSREVYYAVADESRKIGLAHAGHVPVSITGIEAVEAGQASIEHQTGVMEYMARAGDDRVAADRLRTELFDAYARHSDTWHVPTLTDAMGSEKIAGIYADPSIEPRKAYIKPELYAWWKKYWPPDSVSQYPDGPQITLADKIQWVGELAERDVTIMAGTDMAMPGVFPGFSLHDELELIGRAGLAPLAVLQTATYNPARFLGLEKDRGSVEPGKIADLVILDANPLEDISNTKKIAGVMLRGRYLDRPHLDTILEAVRREVSEVST